MADRLTYGIFYFLLIGQLFYALLTWYLIQQQNAATTTMSSYLADLYLPASIIVLSGLVAWFIDQSRRRQAQQFGYSSANGVGHYRLSVFLRSAIIQSGNLLALTMALTTKRMDVLALAIAGFLLYMFFRPSTKEYSERYRG
ncbi:MAG: hypothetical protein AAF828_08525 [Bacteroidota bacterium]